MNRVAIVFVAGLVGTSAAAAQKDPNGALVLRSSVPSRAICQRVANAAPADYVAGVDVRGQAVAPADLNGGFQPASPARISFDVAVDPRLFGAEAFPPRGDVDDAGSALIVANPSAGRVDYDLATGALYFDGRYLGRYVQDPLRERCAELYPTDPDLGGAGGDGR